MIEDRVSILKKKKKKANRINVSQYLFLKYIWKRSDEWGDIAISPNIELRSELNYLELIHVRRSNYNSNLVEEIKT